MSEPVYLDGFATLPLAPEAQAAMIDAWSLAGNAASPHGAGERAAQIIAAARAEVAALIGAAPSEIVFTSGATEANNIAILGAARAAGPKAGGRRRILVSAVEHKAVLESAQMLAEEGFEVLLAPVDRYGRLDLDRFTALLDDQVLLASVMYVNNETGMIQPVAEAATLARAAGALVHCDAAQAAGKIPIDVAELDVDYLSLSAHKCYGPMGVGALYIAAGAPKPRPLHYGGGQQAGIRPGTEPVALIAGFGQAARIAGARLEADRRHGEHLANLLLSELGARQLRFSRVTGEWPVVPGSVAISLDGVDADALCVMLAHTVHLSTGSACTSGQLLTSHVLDAMGFSEEEARTVVRAFCSRDMDDAAISMAAERIATAAARSRIATGEVVQ
jgi:cysteine desulfurase